jgi:hypothetical protein
MEIKIKYSFQQQKVKATVNPKTLHLPGYNLKEVERSVQGLL